MNNFSLLQWIKTKTEVHDDREMYMEKYADRITALLNDMQADGLSVLVVTNVACDLGAVGTTMSSCRMADKARVGAQFIQMSCLATGDEHGAALAGQAIQHRQAFDKCSALH